MSLFSKTEIQFLQGKKHVSKSYEYKLKSILKKKLSALFDKELPLLSPLFPDIDLTKFGKNLSIETNLQNLTNFGKVRKTLTEKRKLVAREGLEGSKSSTVNHKKEYSIVKPQNVMESNSIDEKRRRERDLNLWA